MANVKDMLAEKGTHVLSIGADATALDAALLMNEHKIGGLPVLKDGRVVGMFTERDILQRIVAMRRDPAKIKVADVMTTDITVCSIDTTVEEARTLMKKKRVRHLPIVNSKREPLGLISIGDLNAWDLTDQTKTVYALQQYLYGMS